MSVSTLAKYTLVDDGQTRWYAETADLVAGLVAAGYTYERYQGYDAVAEPTNVRCTSGRCAAAWGEDNDGEDDLPREHTHPRGSVDGPDGGDPYSVLCSLVSPEDREVVMADPETEVESLDYEPGTVGNRRLRVSRDLGEAVYAATPE
jgi:hypothetical protein